MILEQYDRTDSSDIGSMSHARFFETIKESIQALPMLNLPDTPASLPDFWKDLRKGLKDERSTQNLFHEKLKTTPGVFLNRIFLDGNKPGNKFLGQEVIPDECVFEDGLSGPPQTPSSW